MTAAKHSPSFTVGLASILRGDILIPPLRAYLSNPEFRGFNLAIRGIGGRQPDYWFHPSEHPSWNPRSLWLWMVAPHLLEGEPMDPASILAMTAGSVWHAIMTRAMLDLDLLANDNVKFADESTKARGEADGLLKSEAELMEFKGLALETQLPTPGGWTTIADIQVGDRLIGSDGRPCLVTGVSEPKWVDGIRMTFDDGTAIVCDVEHRWSVESGQSNRIKSQVLTTAEIADSLRGSNGQSQHRIINTSPFDLPEIEMPIHPYVLGAWIGDGSKHNGAITQGRDSTLWAEIEACGYRVGEPWGDHGRGAPTRTIYGLRTQLIAMGLLYETKRIPDSYLRASVDQRLALLQGLMDTDGTWSPQRKNAVFTTVESELAEQVRELVLSLGMRCRVQKFVARGFGLERPAFHVIFRPHGVMPFRIKADQIKVGDGLRSGRRVIQRIDRLPTILTKCVEVDSPDHTYLCGDQMVPTHNTMKDVRLRKIQSVEDFIEMYPTYYLQAQEYMRMSGIHFMRFLLMALTFPFPMLEFVVPYDHEVAMGTAMKYREVLQCIADGNVPICSGCDKKVHCPARSVCSSATSEQIRSWMGEGRVVH